MGLSLQTLDELILFKDNEPVPLPTSKRTRALLVYLLLTERMQRRDWLCELLWTQADDPRGALRWSLSRMRPLVNDVGHERLWADRERVQINDADLDIDIRNLAAKVADPTTSVQALKGINRALQKPLLEGIDLPDQEVFQNWLTAERREVANLRGRVLMRLALNPRLTAFEHLQWAREWLELEPLNPEAATCLLTRLEQLHEHWELSWMSTELKQRFQKAGVAWSAKERLTLVEPDVAFNAPSPEQDSLTRHNIHLCVAKDGARLAYSVQGSGRPIVKAATWLSHLEHDWNSPVSSPLLHRLAQNHHLIRYDERGNGLSDWLVNDLSFDAFVTDLETVVEASGVERFALLGLSQGAAVSIAYAAKHPERVSHLVLHGGYAAGVRVDASDDALEQVEALLTLTKTGWGQDNPAYRQLFSSVLMPSADPSEQAWFNDFQRLTTSPENAVRFISTFIDIDVRHLLPQIQVPTLVLHSLGDQCIPVSVGRELAAAIPNAQFQGLDSDGHLLLGREPAADAFIDAVRSFLATN